MKILLYQGVSAVSRLIRLQTRSIYSHAAVELDSGMVIEAWHNGVDLATHYCENHTQGTLVDVFNVAATAKQIEQAACFFFQQLGKKYDFRGVARFLSRRDEPADDRWFCSELVAAGFQQAGIDLLARIPPSHVSPRDLGISPLLALIGQKTV